MCGLQVGGYQGRLLPPKGARILPRRRSWAWFAVAWPPAQMSAVALQTVLEPWGCCRLAPCVPATRPRYAPVTRTGPRALWPHSMGWSRSLATRTGARSWLRSPPSGSARGSPASCGHASEARRWQRWCGWRVPSEWHVRARGRCSSTTMHCPSCLHQGPRHGSVTSAHPIVGAALSHPDRRGT